MSVGDGDIAQLQPSPFYSNYDNDITRYCLKQIFKKNIFYMVARTCKSIPANNLILILIDLEFLIKFIILIGFLEVFENFLSVTP